jgi:RNA polymerase sigma factor (sigma-70 family)
VAKLAPPAYPENKRGANVLIDVKKHPECEHWPLVIWVAKRFMKTWQGHLPGGLELDDLIQEGYLALHSCWRHFDPERGWTFSTYCEKALQRHMLLTITRAQCLVHIPDNLERAIRKTAKNHDNAKIKQARQISKMQRVNAEVLKEQTIPVPSHNNFDLQNELKKLTSLQQQVINLHDQECLTFKAIGCSLRIWHKNVSHQRVRQVYAEGVQILKLSLAH